MASKESMSVKKNYNFMLGEHISFWCLIEFHLKYPSLYIFIFMTSLGQILETLKLGQIRYQILDFFVRSGSIPRSLLP